MLLPKSTPWPSRRRSPTGRRGFSIAEVTIAMVVVGVSFIALYSGITYGTFTVRLARENLRATQIMVEKTEVLRLCTWSQINSNGFIPTTFKAYYGPAKGKPDTRGVLYNGKITIAPYAPASKKSALTPYESSLRVVTVKLDWKSGDLKRERQLVTYVSQHGLHKYVVVD